MDVHDGHRDRVPHLRGFGDVVEAVTTATGIKAATKALAKATGRDCGCARRRDKLNRLIPFKGGTDGVQRDQDRAQQLGDDHGPGHDLDLGER